MTTDRFDSAEKIDWAQGPFNDGALARIDGFPIESAPKADVIGDWAHKSWRAGWADADQEIIANGEVTK